MTYKNKGKPNGRPPNTYRNQQIIADRAAGMEFKAIAVKYNLSLPYARKIVSEHERKERIKKEEEEAQVKASVRLYAERDVRMKKFYASLNKKGALSMTHSLITESAYKGKSA